MPRGRRKKVPVKCVCCGEELDEPYQLIFDETGEELRLCELLADCYNLKVKKDKNKIQAVCDHCLNELIEAFDVRQKELQEKSISNNYINDIKVKIEKIDSDEEPLSEGEYETEILEEQYENAELEPKLYDANIKNEPKTEQDEVLFEIFTQELDGNDAIIVNEENFESHQIEDENIDQVDPDDIQCETLEPIAAELNIDLKAYKSSALCSKFEDVVFPKSIYCRLCNQELEAHTTILDHTRKQHCIDDFAYMCVVDSSCEPQKTLQDLSFHLVFKHYDLEDLTIFVQCPECLTRFSNFLLYNKHSCHMAKNISRAVTECETCGKVFQSNKRYRFHLQFHLPKHRPMACLICDYIFDDENKFFEHVKYAHERNLQMTCLTCDKTFSTEKNLKDHKKMHKIVRRYKCTLCPKSYLDKQMLKDHNVAYHSNGSPYQCHICGKYLNKKTLLNKHIMSHDVPEAKNVLSCELCGIVLENEEDSKEHLRSKHDENQTTIETITIEKAFVCEYCEQAYRSEDTLRLHRDLHTQKQFYCHLCPLVYDEFKKLKTHKLTHANYVDCRTTFPVMRHYMCDIKDCCSTYMHWTSLRSHKRNKHSNKEIKSCEQCPETFENAFRYDYHVDKVHNIALHFCQFCEKTYGSKMALAVHVARKHNTTKIQCDECENTYSNSYDLRRHKKAVHQLFKCDVCDKVMKNRKNLIVHQRMVHEKLKRFYCQYCNKGYFNNCDRLEHESSVHNKIRKYKCDMCPYSCVYKQSLSIHLRKHRNECPYKCNICPKAFRRSYALTLHMRRHNNIRDFVCPYENCNAAYPIQGILNSHIKIKHADGTTGKVRKRRTIAVAPGKRKRVSVPRSTTFVDDDDGLDEGVIGDPPNKIVGKNGSDEYVGKTQLDEYVEIAHDNPDDPAIIVTSDLYIISEVRNSSPAVIVQKNENDHDYIVRPDDDKIFGNVIEEYEIAETEIVTTSNLEH